MGTMIETQALSGINAASFSAQAFSKQMTMLRFMLAGKQPPAGNDEDPVYSTVKRILPYHRKPKNSGLTSDLMAGVAAYKKLRAEQEATQDKDAQ